jgi:hypothetical protein
VKIILEGFLGCFVKKCFFAACMHAFLRCFDRVKWLFGGVLACKMTFCKNKLISRIKSIIAKKHMQKYNKKLVLNQKKVF